MPAMSFRLLSRLALLLAVFLAENRFTAARLDVDVGRSELSCGFTVHKAKCSAFNGANDVTKKPGSCRVYNPCTGESMPKPDEACKPLLYKIHHCTFLQARHWRLLDSPPEPYILLGRQNALDRKTGERLFASGAQILSDIDDTVKCSGGKSKTDRIAGIDSECHGTVRHGLYPGVAAFYYGLSLGWRTGWNTSKPVVENLPVPLTARPAKLKLLLKLKHCKGEDKAFRRKICPGCDKCSEGKIMKRVTEPCKCFGLDVNGAKYGRVSDARPDWKREAIYKKLADEEKGENVAFESGGYERMGLSKFKSFRKVAEKKKNIPYVFIGDNGQGDLTAAQLMLNARPTRLTAAFIHYVRHDMLPGEGEFKAAKEAWAARNIYLFDTYLEAAEIALSLGMISEANFLEIKRRYEEDVKSVTLIEDEDQEAAQSVASEAESLLAELADIWSYEAPEDDDDDEEEETAEPSTSSPQPAVTRSSSTSRKVVTRSSSRRAIGAK
eukprot:TRINITY_DN27378_c0_g2_i1.p1 TRINITY_DN27378_c0_g2~~TRINITY_DN27378_c0_g2_i1.p1  ORF type:complete len:496 (-),score=97.86 TRINITY_DN27378_c0_g2_i1:216-1703(-)